VWAYGTKCYSGTQIPLREGALFWVSGPLESFGTDKRVGCRNGGSDRYTIYVTYSRGPRNNLLNQNTQWRHMANTVDQYCDAVYRFHCCSNLLNGDHTPCSRRYDDCGYASWSPRESTRKRTRHELLRSVQRKNVKNVNSL